MKEVQNAIFKSFYRGTAGDSSDTESENDGEETTEEGNRAKSSITKYNKCAERQYKRATGSSKHAATI